MQDIVGARGLFARLIHAEGNEVACIPNVSSGLAALGKGGIGIFHRYDYNQSTDSNHPSRTN